ncbi:MAG: hypothetical protein Roseis2KO_28550 [Roseivirga sp.]
MDQEELIKQIRKSVIEENLDLYKETFKHTIPDETTISHWSEALSFFKRLNDQDKETLFKIIRQVEVDITAHILGVLDGSSWLEGQEEEFELKIEGRDDLINGELMEIFLELEEEDRLEE